MSTTSIGRLAEQKAANYLTNNYNYNLLAQNWRTRTCEVDLIMEANKAIHFIEVKYRKNNFAGGGITSISPSKLQKMYLATQEWLEQNPNLSDYQINISAIELQGSKFTITQFIESIAYD